jgi:hypothetical protein
MHTSGSSGPHQSTRYASGPASRMSSLVPGACGVVSGERLEFGAFSPVGNFCSNDPDLSISARS